MLLRLADGKAVRIGLYRGSPGLEDYARESATLLAWPEGAEKKRPRGEGTAPEAVTEDERKVAP